MENTSKIKRYKFHVIIAVLLILYCASIAPKALQNDTFYTIKVGEYIAQNGIGNLKEDPFSWHELPYTFPHWLYDLSIYGFYSLGGMMGIYISTIVLTCILGLSIYFTSNKVSKNAPLSAIVTFIAMYLMQPYLAKKSTTCIIFINGINNIFNREIFREWKKALCIWFNRFFTINC